MLGKSASTKKVEVQAKVEKKRVWSSLNLDLAQPISEAAAALDSLFEHPAG
jgi:hypothetical protein